MSDRAAVPDGGTLTGMGHVLEEECAERRLDHNLLSPFLLNALMRAYADGRWGIDDDYYLHNEAKYREALRYVLHWYGLDLIWARDFPF